MAFKGITFASQNVTPKNDGGLYNAHYGDGILWGCSMNISGDDLVIQSGEFIACGRVCQVDGATNVDLSGRTLQTGYIQVLMNYDLSQGEGSQWYTTFVESATTTFPALTQGNINDTDTLYQLELAVLQISGGNLTSIVNSMPWSGVSVKGNSYFKSDISNDITGIINPNWDNGNAIGFGFYGASGASESGVVARQNELDLFVRNGGNGGTIELYPNGTNSTIGRVIFDKLGQQNGGHPVIEKSSSVSVALDGNTKTIATISELQGTGRYLGIVQYYITNVSGTTVFYSRLDDNVDMHYLPSGNWTHYYTDFFIWNGVNTSELIIKADLNTGYTATLTYWRVRAIKF